MIKIKKEPTRIDISSPRQRLKQILKNYKFFELMQLFLRNFGTQKAVLIARNTIDTFSPSQAKILKALLDEYGQTSRQKKFWDENSVQIFAEIFEKFRQALPEKPKKLKDSLKFNIFLLITSYFSLRVAQEKELAELAGINSRLILLKKYKINSVNLKLLTPKASSLTLESIVDEIKKDTYKINRLQFKKNDLVIDIGGHTGAWAIYLAKKFPFIKIYSFEPVPDNFRLFKKNIRVNKVKNIKVFNLAVTGCGQDLEINYSFLATSLASAALANSHLPEETTCLVKSITLDDIFEKNGLKKCKLLKIDCEGTEYEILFNTKYLGRIEYLSGEFHINQKLEAQGYSIKKLASHCQKFIKEKNITLTTTRI